MFSLRKYDFVTLYNFSNSSHVHILSLLFISLSLSLSLRARAVFDGSCVMTMKVLLCRRFKNSHDIQGASHTHKEEKKGKNTRKQKKNFNSIHTHSAREKERKK